MCGSGGDPISKSERLNQVALHLESLFPQDPANFIGREAFYGKWMVEGVFVRCEPVAANVNKDRVVIGAGFHFRLGAIAEPGLESKILPHSDSDDMAVFGDGDLDRLIEFDDSIREHIWV